MTNYDGKVLKMESFTITTDANGEATFVLDATPVDDNALIVWCPTAVRTAEFVSRTGTSVTVRIRKVMTRTNNTLTSVPSGVTAHSTIQAHAGTSGGPGGSSEGGGSDTGQSISGHTHGYSANVTHTYTHVHGADTNTDDLKAASEADIPVTVVYAEN